MKWMTARSLTAVAVLTALASVAMACSGDDTPGGSTAGVEAATTVAPGTESTIGDNDQPAEEPTATTTDATDVASDEPRYATGDDDFLFDQEQFRTFEINLSAADLAILDADPAAEEYVEGSLTFEGETIESIGVRYKGSVGAFIGCTDGPDPFNPSGAKTCTKLSLKLKINHTDPELEFYGVRTVQLHALNFDPTMMRERLGYWMFREMGVPAPRSTHARVVVNGEYIGVFALTEQIDGRFTRANFEDGTGNLYKEVWPFDGNGAAQSTEALADALETNEDEPAVDIMNTFATEVAAAAPEDRLAIVERWTDLETLLTTIVVDRAISNDDGALHWYCAGLCSPHNFFWYEDPSTMKLTLIPWDLDLSFDASESGIAAGVIAIKDPWGEITDDCKPFNFGSFGLPQRSAACDPLLGAVATRTDDFDRIRAELVAGPFSEERVTEQLEAWTAQIESAMAEAADLHSDAPSVTTWKNNVKRFVQFIDESRATDGR